MSTPLRILVADDDRTTTAILVSALKRWGFETVVAADGAAAWDRLESDQPAIAILDWMMPEIDGIELCRHVRADPRHKGLYIILLTSRDSHADMVSGLDAGANDYLTKPVEREELRARVHVGARVARLQEDLSARVSELQAALSQVKQLEGLISICSYCKRIRSDEDNWDQMEQYISEHSQAHFSHSICPECFEKAKEDFMGEG